MMLRAVPASDAYDANSLAEQAVLVLDQLAFKIHRIAQGRLPNQYWDWIADDITPYVESSVLHILGLPRGQAMLARATPKECLERWVAQWVMPYVHERYGVDLAKEPAAPDFGQSDTVYFAPAYPDVLVY